MNKNVMDFKSETYLIFTPCGNIVCLHNIDGKCSMNSCEVYERNLKQEY